MSELYDLAVIGAGPGGYVAAIRASQLGLKVAIIEKHKPGGVCLNIGCIPSKSLIHQANIYRSIPHLNDMGVQVDSSGFDYSRVYQKSRKVAETLSRGVQYLLKKNNIPLLMGEAQIKSANELTVSGNEQVSAKNILIATGSRPMELPTFPFDGSLVLSSDGILSLDKLPKTIVILGAGAIGLEMAYIMNSFAVEVHLVEAMDSILPLEDEECSKIIHRSFKKQGIQIYTSTNALSISHTASRPKIMLQQKDGSQGELDFDTMLVAVGRKPNTEMLGLSELSIETDDKGFINVGDYYETSVPGIYAVGDVVNSPLLAHLASKEGEIAVEHIAGHNPNPRVDLLSVPSAIYCKPELASFGHTEKQALMAGIPFVKAAIPYRAAGKSLTIDEPDGLVKVLYHKDNKEIIGGHIVGHSATELIHELLLAKSAKLNIESISNMIHAHPTLSEAVMEAMKELGPGAIHV